MTIFKSKLSQIGTTVFGGFMLASGALAAEAETEITFDEACPLGTEELQRSDLDLSYDANEYAGRANVTDDLTAKEWAEVLDKILFEGTETDRPFLLNIVSWQGETPDALTLIDAMKERKGPVLVRLTGDVGPGGALASMAADHSYMSSNAKLEVGGHKPGTAWAWGVAAAYFDNEDFQGGESCSEHLVNTDERTSLNAPLAVKLGVADTAISSSGEYASVREDDPGLVIK